MLSEAHNANFIGFWLKEFIRNGYSVPNEFVSDMSMALLNAAVNAFTSYLNLKTYINALYTKLVESTMPLPECFIRIDIAHLVKAVSSCKHLTDKKPKIRETYIRCIGLLIQETDLSEARKIIYSVLIITFSETEGNYDSIDILFESNTQ